jgi:hypothetical protein
VGSSTLNRLTQVIEIPNHCRRRIEIQLSTLHLANPESVGNSRRNENERSSGAGVLMPVQEDNVLTLENVEGLRSIMVDMEWRTKISGLILTIPRQLRSVRVCASGLEPPDVHGHALTCLRLDIYIYIYIYSAVELRRPHTAQQRATG